MITFKTKFRVGWGELDSNGHMANTAYLDLSATARMAYFNDNGFPAGEFHRLGIGPVVKKDEIEYSREFRLMEEVQVELVLAGISEDGSRFRVRNVFTNSDGKVAAVVTSTGGWLDIHKRRLVKPPDELAALLENLPHTEDFGMLPGSLRESRQQQAKPAERVPA